MKPRFFLAPFMTAMLCLAAPLFSEEILMQTAPAQASVSPSWMNDSTTKLQKELTAKYGAPQRERIDRGLHQVAEFWRADDGDAAAFEEFVRTNFAGDQVTLDTMFNRFQSLLEQLDGHMHEITREFNQQSDLDLGPVLPFDEAFAGYDPSAHVLDDFFNNKLAFTVLLNFPLTTLDQRLKDGPTWTRRQWAEVRLAQRFDKRIPADVNLAIAQAGAESSQYIAQYNIWMYHVLDPQGQRLFPPKMRLLSHWNLRDEIKADYSDPQTGPAKQRMIQQVMERIVTQTIPEVVINNPNVDWNPYSNEVKTAAVKDSDAATDSRPITNAPEPDTRYAKLLKTYIASRKADPYSPTAPTLIDRRFQEDREIPEARVKAMLEQVLSSPLVAQTAQLIQVRLGRPLEPFDVWYNGFRPGSQYSEAQLDEIVAKKYPTRRGLPERHSQSVNEARLHARPRSTRRQQHHRRPGPRLGPRHGSRHARRKSSPPHPRRKNRHELQRLQHRRPRNGTQRRANLLAERQSTTPCCKACPTPHSPKPWHSSSRATTSNYSACPHPTPKAKPKKP